MPRRVPIEHLWNLEPDDPVAIANARIVQALWRCARALPGAYPENDFDTLGMLIAPIFDRLLTPLRAAVKTYVAAAAAKGRSPVSIEPHLKSLLHDRQAHTMLGEALTRGTLAFRSVFDKAEAKLTTFVAAHAHPSDQNIDTLSRMLSLAPPEISYLRLATAFCHGSIERRHFSFVDSGPRLIRAIETLCGVPGSKAMRIFDADRSLARSGLLEARASKRSRVDLDDMLQLSAVGERLLSVPYSTPAEMSAAVLTSLPLPSGTETLEWPHLRPAQSLLSAALAEALERRTPGLNILLHGSPGTGKTEYARQLLAEIGAAGFAIDHADNDGDEASRGERLASLRLSQTFASQHERAVLVLDEAEDIFQSDYQHPLSRLFRSRAESKAWMNSLLETNAHPVIWISNQVHHLDPAYLRRFTVCLEFPPTPHLLRRKITEQQLGAVGCSLETIDSVAAREHTAPALLATAVRFCTLSVGSSLGPDVAVRTFLDEHAKAAGHQSAPLRPRRLTRFDMQFLNVEGTATPPRLLQALRTQEPAALLFSGPPGTGKTQFATEIASQLGRQLVVRTASDINTKWYGESEANVARMFRECDPTSELLFLDEAEVLLGSRGATAHRADRAVTAEFLRWLEAFQGIFICATNHPTDFDAALTRRFTFRLEFRPLDQRQRLALYSELALERPPEGGLAYPDLDAATTKRLAQLELLTPGDFANVARRVRSLRLGAEHWIGELEAEHRVKGSADQARIGFM